MKQKTGRKKAARLSAKKITASAPTFNHRHEQQLIKKYDQNWRSWQFWQKLWLYFFVFSFVGHVVEVIWAPLVSLVTGRPPFVPINFFTTRIAPPYGVGIVAVILIVIPLIQKFHFKEIGTFVISALATGAVEFIYGLLMIVMFGGENYFWNYSERSFNLLGQISLENCVFFGLGALVFLKWLYPWCEKMLAKLSRTQLNFCFWLLMIVFWVDFIHAYLNWTPEQFHGIGGQSFADPKN